MRREGRQVESGRPTWSGVGRRGQPATHDVEPVPEEQRGFDAQRSRELSERQPVSLTIGHRPFQVPTMGAWNLFLCILGVAIPIAIIVVNMI